MFDGIIDKIVVVNGGVGIKGKIIEINVFVVKVVGGGVNCMFKLVVCFCFGI